MAVVGQDLDLNFLSNIGAGGLLCWLVLKEVFAFLKKDKSPDSSRELQDWISGRDMERALIQLVEVAKQQTKISEQILDEQRSMRLYLGKIVLIQQNVENHAQI